MIRFGNRCVTPVFCATGARGFWGEGYPFHKIWRRFGMDWKGTGFSGKTMTLLPHRGKDFKEKGNMPLREDGTTPIEWFPKCIHVDFFRNGGEMFNAVGLASFGLEFYLRSGKLHTITDPFFISIALDSADPAGQEEELRDVCRIIGSYMPFRAPIAVQLNEGCPNNEHEICQAPKVISHRVEIVKSILGVPVWVNCNALMPTEVLKEVSRVADGLWIGNTIPWRAPETVGRIDWDRYGDMSPIRARGIAADGGLSSHQCLQFTVEKVAALCDNEVRAPIVAGNGIRTTDDIDVLHKAGANGVFVGSLAVVRPLRFQEVVAYATRVFF